MPISLLTQNPMLFVAWVAAVVIGIGVHEYSHVLAAYLQGDETGKDLGRLTLNPLAHIDPLGLLLLVFIGFGWGRPAPYNPNNLRRPRVGSTIIALAGPVSNLLLIIVFGLLFRLVLPLFNLAPQNLLVVFFIYLIQVNIVLMVFNLLPVPPLDGSRVLLNALSDRHAAFKISFERYGPFILFALIFFGGGIFSGLFRLVTSLAARVIG